MGVSRNFGFTASAVLGFLVAATAFRRHKSPTKPVSTVLHPSNTSERAGLQQSAENLKAARENMPTGAKRKRKKSVRRFVGYWVIPLLVIAAGSTLAAYNIWKGGFSSDGKPPSADGGLLFFTAAPLTSQVEATINADINQTGYTGISLLDLTVNFQHAYPGLQWFIAASGQYAPSIETPLGAYCPGGTPASRSGSVIACKNDIFEGSSNVRYRFTDHIGSIDGRQIDSITDSLDGYIDSDTVIVSGSLQANQPGGRSPVLTTRVTIPIQTPMPTQLGSDKYFAYAPIAPIDQGDFGTGSSLGEISGSANPEAYFADSATRSPVNYLNVTSSNFYIDLGSSLSELSWASPPTIRSDRLQWQSNGQGIGQVTFTLHDPFAADRLSKYSFIAGILASVAASALLLLIEKAIEWKADQEG